MPDDIEQRIGLSEDSVRHSYDRVAEEYTRRVADELDGKPFDRDLLGRVAEDLRGNGVVCDMGCGPGHVGRYMADRGAAVLGIDLSPGMIAEAHRRNPAIGYLAGDMRRLPVADGSWAAIVAFYAIVHLAPEDLPRVFGEFYRTLRPGGLVVLAFHVGDEVVHHDEWWERPVCLDFVLHPTARVVEALQAAGFGDARATERNPYPDVEFPSRRAYVEAVRA